VTAYTRDLLFNSGISGSLSLVGTLAGVAGTLSGNATTGRGTATYTFTRAAAGAAVDCPANTPFVPDFGVQGRARVQIFTFGRNDGPNNVGSTVLPFWPQPPATRPPMCRVFWSAASCPHRAKRSAPLPPVTRRSRRPIRVALSIWPPCPRLKKWRSSASSPTAMVPTATVARTLRIWPPDIPSGMRSGATTGNGDFLHLNNFGYSLWALRYYRAIVALGWWPSLPTV
jgi:hypothetical protein